MRPLAVLLIPLVVALAAPVGGDETGAEAPGPSPAPGNGTATAAGELQGEPSDLVDRIIDLRRQLDELESRLSPEAREILEARLVELEAANEAVAEAEVSPELATREPSAAGARMVRPTCNTLVAFDTSGDGAVSGVDRYWRYLGLWIDDNGDGLREDSEMVHPFDIGIVEISSNLKRFRTEPEGASTIRHGDRLYFEQLGKKGQAGVLLVDATRIRRGDGLDLRSASGEPLEGLHEFERGLTIVAPDGERTAINCP